MLIGVMTLLAAHRPALLIAGIAMTAAFFLRKRKIARIVMGIFSLIIAIAIWTMLHSGISVISILAAAGGAAYIASFALSFIRRN